MIVVATVTVSDTRTPETDRSGPKLRERLSAAGFALAEHAIVPDEPDAVRGAVHAAERAGAQAVIFSGGTGIAPRDQTYEALESLFDKRLDGFGEAFRRLSWDAIGPRAVLSRATAGTVGRLLVVSLPGSPGAVTLAVDAILAGMLEHAVALLAGKGKHA